MAKPFNSSWKKNIHSFHFMNSTNYRSSQERAGLWFRIFDFPRRILQFRSRREMPALSNTNPSACFLPYTCYWFILPSLAAQKRQWQLTRFDFPCDLPPCWPHYSQKYKYKLKVGVEEWQIFCHNLHTSALNKLLYSGNADTKMIDVIETHPYINQPINRVKPAKRVPIIFKDKHKPLRKSRPPGICC